MRTVVSIAGSAARPARRVIARAPFEVGVLFIAAIYVALHLSPSSYALALNQLGENASPLVGQPRGIRTDEWSVMTPLFQAAVNNDFGERNATSFYDETLRSFIGLPLLNWGLVFKPLVWPFLIIPPGLAYSFFWGATAALMLVGWSLLLRSFGLSRTAAALTSTILYFSPFVQAWSGPSPLLAIFPWLVLAFVRIGSHLRLGLTIAVLLPVWLMSVFYLPAVPPLVYLGLALCLALAPEAFAARRIVATAAGAAIGGAIAYVYFAPVLQAYADSIYPGRRWYEGGGLPTWQVLSQFLPGTTTEGYVNLVAANICEAATVATWLPLAAACVLDYRSIRQRRREPSMRQHLRGVGVLGVAWVVLTLWQLVPLEPLSYLFGLGLSPEARTLFASGTLLLVTAAYALDKLPLQLTPGRLTAFALLVVGAWIAAVVELQPERTDLVRDELLVLVIVAGIVPFAMTKARSQNAIRVAILLLALVPTAIGWGLFNPLQDTRVIFRKPDTAVTRELDLLAKKRTDGAIAVKGIPDAILNGIGYRSVTHVLATPDPDAFRRFFPDLEESRFDLLFNRFAHFSLTDEPEPFLVLEDNVRLPIQTMAQFASTLPRDHRTGR